MKRLLLGLSVLSGVALVSVFAIAQLRGGGGAGANTTAGTASAGQSAAPGDPWVQPMPQGMQANPAQTGAPSTIGGGSGALGSDPFAGLQPQGQRSSMSTAASVPSQGSSSATSGVKIRSVNSRQIVEEQGAGPGGLANGADPFNSMPPYTAQPGVASRGNESNVGGGPTPLHAEPAIGFGAQPGSGSGNPLRGGQNADAGGAATGFYDAAASRGSAPGLRGAAPSELPAVGDGRNSAVQEPAAFPPVELPASGSPRGQVGAPSQAFSGAPPHNQDQSLGGRQSPGGAASGIPGGPAPLAGAPASRAVVGQLASATIRGEGLGLPGGKQLEGNQLPTLAIQKFAPPEVQVNKPAVFEIHVRNTGPVTAREVVIQDRVPQGTVFVRSSPDTTPTPQGDLEWRFDALPPREQRVIKVEVRPLKRGEIGSVATVRFSADASARSRCTCPDLQVEVGAARQTLIGDPLALTITVANRGDGPATGVVIAEQVPDKFEHAQGQLLENELGTLKPGELRELKLTLKAARPGTALNRLLVRADGDVRVEKQLELEVVAPALDVAVQGPQEQLLQREATYAIHVENRGTAAAKSVRLSTLVPVGFRFVAANNYGEFDPKTGRVNWELVELPAGQKDRVELKLLAAEPGRHQLEIQGSAQRNVQASGVHPVGVKGVVAVGFQVAQVQRGNALEIGAEKVYEIKVTNDGTQAASDVFVVVGVPKGLQPLGGNGPLQGKATAEGVVFGPLPRLAPRADTSFFVHLRAQAAGDHVVRFQVSSAEQQAPITKEEIVLVR